MNMLDANGSAACAECGRGARDERDRLKAENAKLREDMEDIDGYDQMLRDRLRQETELRAKAESDNGRLRGLVRDMYDYYIAGTLSACDVCDSLLDCENHPAMSCKYDEYDVVVSAADDQFADRMRELGIEV